MIFVTTPLDIRLRSTVIFCEMSWKLKNLEILCLFIGNVVYLVNVVWLARCVQCSQIANSLPNEWDCQVTASHRTAGIGSNYTADWHCGCLQGYLLSLCWLAEILLIETWDSFNIKAYTPGVGNLIIKIRHLWDCLIITIGTPMSV